MMLQLRSKHDTFQRAFSLAVLLLLVLSVFASPRPGQAAQIEVLPKVGLITDGGPIDDRSFNQMAYEGLTRAETDGLIDGTVYIPVADEYTAAINQCVSESNVLCITVGFLLADATMSAASANPGVKFMIVDYSWEEPQYPANLRGSFFAVDEAAYLAGTMAGLMSESDKIGVIGGMSIPPVNDFILPYIYGAQWANHGVVAFTRYTNNFEDESVGASAALGLISHGADVIFGVGGQMGNGAIKAAAGQGAWVVGVDVDTYFTAFEAGTVPGSDKLITSVLKKVDNAVYQTIQDQVNNTYSSGTKLYNVANDGVGLALYHEAEDEIPVDVTNQINIVANGIANGSINVHEPYWKYYVYLPVTVK